MNNYRQLYIIRILIILIAGLLFIPFLGDVHLFDWDEINFAESAREMLITGDYMTVQINYEPFWEKPPLFIWMQALSMHIFGINEFAARFPNAICGIVTLLVLFNTGYRLFNTQFGLIWVITFLCSLLPFFYFKSGIIDPWFNLFIFLGIVNFHKALNNKITISLILSAFFLGLAVLTKGPAGFLIFAITVVIYWMLNRFRLPFTIFQVLLFLFVFIIIGGFWFILQIITGNAGLIIDFINYQIRLIQTQDAGHGGFLFYHFVVLFFGVFPASVFTIHGFFRSANDTVDHKQFKKWMIILFWTVLILFTIVRTKIIHYSSLCYFPMTFLAAYSIHKILSGEFRYKVWHTVLFSVQAFVLTIIGVAIPLLDHYKHLLIDKGYITHSFTIGNLQASADWKGYEILWGVLFAAGFILAVILIHKKRRIAGFAILFSSSLFYITFAVLIITPRLEKYIQNAAIEFFKDKTDRDVYVMSMYKSYAQFFYTRKKPDTDPYHFSINKLTKGEIDKPAYFIGRLDKKQDILNNYSKLKVYNEKYGYVFFVRYPGDQPN